MKKAIGVLGTMSSAGKSTMALLLIRYMKKYLHLDVVPFKGQNMSLNAKVTPDGYEIASAQYYQALAAEVVPSFLFNPILLKPGGPTKSFMIVNGKPSGEIGSKNWISRDRQELWKVIKHALSRLMESHDYIVIEGAGSPAEINLKKYDITNMKPIMFAGADSILVADIDRGGSFAQIVGTMELLTPEERRYIKVFVLNKFRGDESLLKEGIDYLYRRYGIPTVVFPYIKHNLPEEDALKTYIPPVKNDITAVTVKLPHMSNHDDLDPLIGNVNLQITDDPATIENAHIIILTGSRKVVKDIVYMKAKGIDKAILKAHQKGAFIIGICGGFQMLGREIHDPHGIEETPGIYKGLGLIDMHTVFAKEKTTGISKGHVNKSIPIIGGIPLKGYEIHHGTSQIDYPFAVLNGKYDGYYKDRIIGTYLHGLFANRGFSETFLNMVRETFGYSPKPFKYTSPLEETDRLLEEVKDRIEYMVQLLDI